MNDRAKEYYFQWSSGIPLGEYNNWIRGEPNDNSGTENCVEMRADDGLWNDKSCNQRNPFICEHPLGKFILYTQNINPLNVNTTKWSNTLKQFVGCCRRIV